MPRALPDEQIDRKEGSKSLLEYYKKRVDDFEVERADLLRRISSCSASASEAHNLRCAAQKRAEEVRELQQALSAAHMHLFEERDRLLQLQAENDELRLQEAEDRRRLQHLMSLTHPVDQEVTLSRGAEPTSGVLYPRSGTTRQGRGAGDRPGAPAAVAPVQRVLRTVYLPSANADALQLKVESLQAQLEEQKQFAAERFEAMKQDRELREQDEEAHRQNYQQQIQDLTAKIKRTEEVLRSTTTDFILCRRDKQEAQTQAAAAEQMLRDSQQAAAAKVAATKQSLQERIDKLIEQHEAALEKETKAAAKQLKAREMELNQLETMHSAVKAQLEERVADLGSKLARTKDALAKSEHRRALDAEGFTNDVTLLRKQLKAVDRKLHQTRLQSRLHDDERLEVVLKKVEPKGQHQLEENRPSTKGLKGAASDLKRIRRGLQGMDKRLYRQVLKPANAIV